MIKRDTRMLLRGTLTLMIAAVLSLSIVATALAANASITKHKTSHKSKKKKKKKKKSAGATVKVTSGSLTLTFSAQAWSTLNGGVGGSSGTGAGIATTPVTPATSTPAGAFTFPLTGGSINSSTGYGTLDASGGLTISSHVSVGGLFESSSTAIAESPVLTLGTTSTLTVTSQNFSPPTVPLLSLALKGIKPSTSAHAVTLTAIPATITPAGQEFFGSSFKAGEQIATATIQAAG